MPETAKPDPLRPHPHPGLFLALEGPDGGGKTTQAARLAAWLRDDGFDVVSCRDPGSTKVGDRLREIVLDRDSVHLSIRSEMLIYMASRAQLVDEVIRQALAAGRVVISDRFLLSNIVYQGFAGGLPVEDLWRIGQIATAGLLPDLTLVLDVSPGTARVRVGSAPTGSRTGPPIISFASGMALPMRSMRKTVRPGCARTTLLRSC